MMRFAEVNVLVGRTAVLILSFFSSWDGNEIMPKFLNFTSWGLSIRRARHVSCGAATLPISGISVKMFTL